MDGDTDDGSHVNSEDFDEVVYLDKVIKHLNDAERNMQYVPSVITRK